MAEGLNDILDTLEEQSESNDELSVGGILDAFDGRTFGPLVLAIGLIAITPIGAIPFVPTTLAVLLLGVVGQTLAGLRHPWVPKQMRERSVGEDKIKAGIKKARPWAKRVDRVIKPRLTVLTEGPMRYVLAGLSLPLALTMPPLELVPFAVFIPGVGVVLLGLSQAAKDGALAIVAVLFSLGATGFTIWWFFLK